MKKDILEWLKVIEEKDGTPPYEVIAFNLGLTEGEDGFMMYFIGAFEYNENDDDWACVEPPTKPYRYLTLPKNIQNQSWKTVSDLTRISLLELENDGSLNTTLIKNAIAITTGFDDSELIKIR
jgi:hypothetical protein